MKIKEMENEKEWNDFLMENGGSFTQSIDWGNFKKKNQRVERIEARKEGELVGVCQFLEEDNPFGEYFYVPYGPVGETKNVRDALFKKVLETGRKEGKTFVKAEPMEDIDLGQVSNHRMQPKKTLIKNISGDLDEILQSFESGTRYDVRYSKRKGVKVKVTEKTDEFFALLEKTRDRQDFETFPKTYFENLLKTIDSDLFLAFSEKGKVVASTIFGYFGKTATSLHSAFDYEKRKLRATALVRFEAIKKANQNGCTRFDAWGIDEEKMPGVTKFKKGFGGKEVEYPEARDIPIKQIIYKGYKTASGIIKNN